MKNKLKDILIKNGRGGKRVEKTIDQILELFEQRERKILEALEYTIEEEYGEGKEVSARIIDNLKNKKLKI